MASTEFDALMATTQLEREKADGIKSLVSSAKATAKAQQERDVALAEVAKLRAVLTEALATFWAKTHPGLPCRRSEHVAQTTIDRWREALS